MVNKQKIYQVTTPIEKKLVNLEMNCSDGVSWWKQRKQS